MPYLKSAWGRVKGSGVRLAERFPFITKKRFYLPLLLVLIAGIAFAAFSKPEEPQFETALAAHQNVIQTVSETGIVEPAREVELSFTGTGRIQRVYVSEGEMVRQGELVATLNGARQYADLLAARARFTQARATAQSSSRSEMETQEQQDQLVENARRALLSNDLQAFLVKASTEEGRVATPPTISGTYTCDHEGTYRLELRPSYAESGRDIHITGLENATAPVSTTRPVPIGECGLYIQFPESFVRNSVVWEVSIPNTRSSTYQTTLNAYTAALQNRDLALEESEDSLVLSAQVLEAEAAVAAAEAAYAETRLTAPFAGMVTNVDAVRGDIASVGTPAVSLISSEAFEIVILVPEDDIGEVNVGDEATVTFDAYEDVEMIARVSFIAPRATVESGAAQFEVTLQFTEQDERIRAGLSVDADIAAALHADVLAVPIRAVLEEDDIRHVRVMVSDTTFRRTPVTTGLSGDGMIEIRSGLSEGDRVITFANDEALAVLTEEE